jgi:D-arabinose 1-dehydrogenase-like Zn-dependent alcohol dehydrogenase
MKAAVVPGVNRNWEVKDIPVPEPGPNQVLIKIAASELCYTDVYITKGAISTQFPRTLRHEPVGKIMAIEEGHPEWITADEVGRYTA